MKLKEFMLLFFIYSTVLCAIVMTVPTWFVEGLIGTVISLIASILLYGK